MVEKSQENTEKLWSAFSASIELWQHYSETLQKIGEKSFTSYLEGVKNAINNANFEEVKKYNELWEKAITNFKSEKNSFYNDSWAQIWKESSFATYDAFYKYWKEIMNNLSDNVQKISSESLENMRTKPNN